MNRPGRKRPVLLAAASATALVALLPATSAGADAPVAFPAATGITLDVKGGSVPVLRTVTARGQVGNPLGNENVTVTIAASGRELATRKITPKPNGSFEVPIKVEACCRYVITAEVANKRATATFGVDVPKKLRKGPIAALYNSSLQAAGFHTGTKGGRVTIGTRLATKAFRKTNGMSRSEAYKPGILRTLLRGDGAYEPRYDDGRHVEVDISRQVMSLIEGDTPVHTFHVSTGASSTPTIRGKFRFYLRQAGYNSKRMYYSVYFRGGYATHGYNPVPNYNASHGCVRNPIPFSRFIYNWVAIGMPIYVYE